MLAKSLAGRAARIAATQCQQVLAGIGFTAEHPVSPLPGPRAGPGPVLGSAAELPTRSARQLVAAGDFPRLAEL